MSLPPTKRQKILDGYLKIQPHADKERETKDLSNTSLNTDNRISGLSIIPSFVSPSEQGDLLAFLDSQSWRTDLSRRTMHYGGTYCLTPPRNATPSERMAVERNIITAPPIPKELDWLVDRMVDQGLYQPHARPEYYIVNEYLPPHGISAHVENFRFGEPVCSLTLGSGDSMRLHELEETHDGSVRSFKAAQAPRTGRKEDVWLPSGSLLALKGDARYWWQHEIVKRKKGRLAEGGERWRRVSLTFRVEKRRGEGSGTG